MTNCPSCNTENPAGMKFCGECGSPLPNKNCPDCAFENPPNFKFCGQCGASLVADNQQPSEPPKLRPAERRQLTVMFCDLVGSTALSEQLDPEDLREVITVYQETAAAAIKQFDGFIAQYLGDGILVYFGYPVAHEDDAQRAIRVGLEIIESMSRLNQSLGQPVDLQVRIGIHTGLVVVGEVGDEYRRDQLALGETTNVAARMQGLAQPNTLVISEASHRLVRGYFTFESLGGHTVKGISHPIQVYRVLRQTLARSRLDVAMAASTGLTPLVGREQEVDLLRARWEQVVEGQGQVVLISGEAGIGKSRLVQAFREQLETGSYYWLDCRGSSYHQNSALYPFIDLLQRLLEFDEDDTPKQKLDKLEGVLQRYKLPLNQMVPLFALLLSLPVPQEKYASLNLSPQGQKQKTLEALLAVLLKLSEKWPVLILVEDLHWVDASTLEMLDTLVEQVSAARVLALFTFRPGFKPIWTSHSHLTHLSLNRLTRNQIEQMVEKIAGTKELPPQLLQQVLTKTDGVPIFVEELTRMMLENNPQTAGQLQPAGDMQELAIPATLQDLLMARLDRLGSVREVAQLGATLGREFIFAVILAISTQDEQALSQDLDTLVDAELLYQRGLPPQAVYTFKHALIQEAAYHSLLRSSRQDYHRRIALLLSENFPELAKTEPELLAHHFTAARLNQQAIVFWRQAGEQAVERSANIEAIRHFEHALSLLDTLPEGPGRTEQELQLRVALGASLLMVKGYAADEVEIHYSRARSLCRQIEDIPQLLSALFGLWSFYLVRAQYKNAFEMAERLMQLALKQQDSGMLLAAHQVQGVTFFYQGNLVLARKHLELAVDLYDPEEHSAPASAASSADRGVASLSHLALTLWLLGYPDQARERIKAALMLAETLEHPYSVAFASVLAGWLYQYCREAEQVATYADAAVNLSNEQGFALLGAFGTILKGWAQTDSGQAQSGSMLILEGLSGYKATGAQLGQLHFLAMLAEAHSKMGQIEEGLAVLAGALVALEENGERFYEAEVYRLQGDLLSQEQGGRLADRPDELSVENCYQKAIEVAHEQQAKSMELRATLSLSKLWQEQGHTAIATRMLQTIYDEFTEGFDTADLQEAEAILNIA